MVQQFERWQAAFPVIDSIYPDAANSCLLVTSPITVKQKLVVSPAINQVLHTTVVAYPYTYCVPGVYCAYPTRSEPHSKSSRTSELKSPTPWFFHSAIAVHSRRNPGPSLAGSLRIQIQRKVLLN